MSTHEGLPVAGYRPQTNGAIDLVNQNKRMEEQLLRRLDYLTETFTDIDKRWLAIGRTHIEEAFMAINRAIFKPARLVDEPPSIARSPTELSQ